MVFNLDPVELVDLVYVLIKNLQLLAKTGQALFTKSQIINFTKNIDNRTRKFKTDIKYWNCKPPVNNTWINFKIQFCQSQKKLHETDELRLNDQFQYANLIQDIVSGLSDVLLPTSEDNSTITHLYMDTAAAPPSPQFDHYGASIPPLPLGSLVIQPLQVNAIVHQ